MTVYADCTTCRGSGLVMGGDEYQTCPGCRLRSRREESVEQEWCDAGPSNRGHYVAVGSTVPYERGSQFRMCLTCRDRLVAAHEAHVEGQWKALIDAGADEMTLRAMAGDR